MSTPMTVRPQYAAGDGVMRRVLLHCLDIDAIWSLDHEPGDACAGEQPTRLLAFADMPTLKQLRAYDSLHSSDVELLVVIDGDLFASAWGACKLSGSLARWAWRRVSSTEAFYDESRWADDDGGVIRLRRKAFLLWQR
jgi:hypothetical protein